MDTGRMTERYLRFYQRDAGAPGVRAGWNGAEPPALPPLTAGERLRLVLRAASGRWRRWRCCSRFSCCCAGVDLGSRGSPGGG